MISCDMDNIIALWFLIEINVMLLKMKIHVLFSVYLSTQVGGICLHLFIHLYWEDSLAGRV